jgi:hypothetical protein
MIFVFCFPLIQHLYTLGQFFYFLSTSFPEPILKAILFQQRKNERRILKTKYLFFSFIRWVLFTTRCYYVGNILSFKRWNAGSFIFHPNPPSIERKRITVLLSSILLKEIRRWEAHSKE